MEKPKVKICGITAQEEAEYLNEAGVDYAGFVLYPKSKRFIEIAQAKEIFEKLNKDIIKVAVMVAPTEEEIIPVMKAGFDCIQIHKKLRKEVLQKTDLPIWYAVNISKTQEFEQEIKSLQQEMGGDFEKIKAFVADGAEYGSGKTFDWHPEKKERWRKSLCGRKLVLAGGLQKENVAEGIRMFTPDVVDVSSGVEGAHGKEKEKIMQFVQAVHLAQP